MSPLSLSPLFPFLFLSLKSTKKIKLLSLSEALLCLSPPLFSQAHFPCLSFLSSKGPSFVSVTCFLSPFLLLLTSSTSVTFYFLLIYFEREGKGGRKRARERAKCERYIGQLCRLSPACPHLGTWPTGMCPDWELSWQLFCSQADAQSTKTQETELCYFLNKLSLIAGKKNFKHHAGFQVYNSIIHHLHIALCAHNPKSSIFPPLFIPSLPLCLFLPPASPLSIWQSPSSVSVFFLILSSFSTSPPTSSPLTSVSLFSVSMSLFLFCLLVYFVY